MPENSPQRKSNWADVVIAIINALVTLVEGGNKLYAVILALIGLFAFCVWKMPPDHVAPIMQTCFDLLKGKAILVIAFVVAIVFIRREHKREIQIMEVEHLRVVHEKQFYMHEHEKLPNHHTSGYGEEKYIDNKNKESSTGENRAVPVEESAGDG